MRLLTLCGVICFSIAAASVPLTPEQRKLNIDSFEYIWKTVREKHWDPKLGGLDWQAIHDELRPKIENAGGMTEARAIVGEMIARLHQTHFGIVPSDVYREMNPSPASGEGVTGIDVRVIRGKALVTKVEERTSAASKGIRPGWEIVRVGGEDLAMTLERIEATFKNSTLHDLLLARAVTARLDGQIGKAVPVEFVDGNERKVQLDIDRGTPRGAPSQFGFLPKQYVWIEFKKTANIGYIAFNMFLDPARLFSVFEEGVKSCMGCDGIIVDLRGNSGGIGGMAMGMAGFFVSRPNQELGTMYTRQFPMKFAINPRLPVYEGPLAFLVDGLSASTSEIFAGGMKDLHRARIFGTRTAGAALPSAFEMLPNGDGFQYAFASYISAGGQALEGTGVSPDVAAGPSRDALLAGRDPALEAAMQWIQSQTKARSQ